ncbi:hypothetical protein OAQ48_04650 [Candidatus Pelagibacter sp.]|jgi:opacity protein-like surface antigen|nr:hypothetical protein [Candidatus Pelagibacter sp.]
MKKILITVITSFLFVTNAMSIDFGSIRPGVGVSTSTAGFYAQGTERNCNEDCSVVSLTQSAGAFQDDFNSIFVEVGNDYLAIGLDYVVDAIHTPENINEQGDNGTTGTKTNKASADFENLTTMYIKANPLHGIRFVGGLYLKAGHASVDVNTTESLSSGRAYASTSTSGYMAGIGYELDVPNGISIRIEAVGHQFDDVSADNGVAATGNRNVIEVSDMMGARASLSLVKTF